MAEPERLLDTDELAARLKLSRLYVSDLCRAGAIPGVFKMGRQWRMSESAFAEYVRQLSEGEITSEPPAKTAARTKKKATP